MTMARPAEGRPAGGGTAASDAASQPQKSRTAPTSTAAVWATEARSTHSSAVCSPWPEGPKVAQGMPASTNRPESPQAISPQSTGGRPRTAPAAAATALTTGSSCAISIASRATDSAELGPEPGVGDAGLPVCVGAADSVLAAEALGAVDPGTVAYVWGTSTVILGASTELTLDPDRRCLVTPLAIEGWGVEMDLVSTGAAVAWLARLLGFGSGGQADVVAAAATARDVGVPIALPFVGVGEQGALWDNDVRGTLVGLDLSHGPGDVARAVLDGIILESRCCLARLNDLGLPAGEVRVAWRGADPWFCGRLASATGRTVLVGDPAETSSAAGAARLAAIAAGVDRRPRARATSAMNPTRRKRASGTGAGRSTRTSCVRSDGSTASGRPSPGSGEAPQ